MTANVAAIERNARPCALVALLLAACGGARGDDAAIVLLSTEQLAARIAAARGKPLIVNFWATWCGPCLAEMPDFTAGTKDFCARGGMTLGVAMEFAVDGVTTESALAKVQKKRDQLSLPFPIAICSEGDLIALRNGLGLDLGALPQTVAYDRNGEIAAIHDGVGTTADFEELCRLAER